MSTATVRYETEAPQIFELLGGVATRRAHFSEAEITALTAAIAMINLWNRFQISRHWS